VCITSPVSARYVVDVAFDLDRLSFLSHASELKTYCLHIQMNRTESKTVGGSQRD
jgi:hypothetical protein